MVFVCAQKSLFMKSEIDALITELYKQKIIISALEARIDGLEELVRK